MTNEEIGKMMRKFAGRLELQLLGIDPKLHPDFEGFDLDYPENTHKEGCPGCPCCCCCEDV